MNLRSIILFFSVAGNSFHGILADISHPAKKWGNLSLHFPKKRIITFTLQKNERIIILTLQKNERIIMPQLQKDERITISIP